jgi:hypothetical protein
VSEEITRNKNMRITGIAPVSFAIFKSRLLLMFLPYKAKAISGEVI